MKEKILSFFCRFTPVKWLCFVFVLFSLLAIAFFLFSKDQLNYDTAYVERAGAGNEYAIGAIEKGKTLQQQFTPTSDSISGLSILFGTYNRVNEDKLYISISSLQDNRLLFSETVETQTIKDNAFFDLNILKPIPNVNGKELVLEITSESGAPENAVTIYAGATGAPADQKLYFGGEIQSASICFQVTGRAAIPYAFYYWMIFALLGLAILVYGIYAVRKKSKNEVTLIEKSISAVRRYQFLLSQLVIRDFKTKYKRSFLGVMWSLLNPLLTMAVQYMVFSKLFRFEIPNYPVYLLSGSVMFSYMSEATSQSMMCIVQNASLINKVYVPKYIYPFSRVLSCGVNFLFSLIALYIVIILTGVPITTNHIFIIYGILCMFLFICGVSLILAPLMVYFRDTQFLYGVFMQMWIYLTPLFYTESILPGWVMRIVECNPMYHFIRFIRIIILNGVLPEAKAWAFCAIFAIVPFVVGALVFKKLQKKFILYI